MQSRKVRMRKSVDGLNKGLSRRSFLAMASATPIALMAPAALAAHPERGLSFDNLHTGESIQSVVWRAIRG